MAEFDVMPFDGPNGAHPRVQWGRMTASEVFFAGEPVAQVAAGTITEMVTQDTGAGLLGIAVNGPGASEIDPNTGTTYATGAQIGVYIPDSNTHFITRNWSEAGTTFTDTAPVIARIGQEAGLILISGSWGLDYTASAMTCRVTDILDENGMSLTKSGGTVSLAAGKRLAAPAYYVVFKIVSHQGNPAGAAEAPV